MRLLNRQQNAAVCCFAAAVALAVLWPGGAAADESDQPVDWSAQARLGAEYDNNPYRIEDAEEPPDMLTRYFVGGDVSGSIIDRGQLMASIRHGGTFFRRETDANAMLTQADASVSWHPTDAVYVQGLADVKDRTERDSRRDYIRGGAALRVGTGVGDLRGWIDGGGRVFGFKPTPRSSWQGPQVRAGLRWLARDDLAVDASIQRAWRMFDTEALQLQDEVVVPADDGADRRDRFDSLRVSATYQRQLRAQIQYLYARNDSNTYGQGMHRHGVEVDVTVPLIWETFLSARAELQRTRYEDPVALDDMFVVDEDQRNAVVAALRRPLTEVFDVELRYSLYLQEFGVGGEYARQVVALAVSGYLE